MESEEAEALVRPDDASLASAPVVKLTQKERKAVGKAAKRAIRDEEDRVRLAKRAAMFSDKSQVLLKTLQLTPLLALAAASSVDGTANNRLACGFRGLGVREIVPCDFSVAPPQHLGGANIQPTSRSCCAYSRGMAAAQRCNRESD
jgi:hypothetical protein